MTVIRIDQRVLACIRRLRGEVHVLTWGDLVPLLKGGRASVDEESAEVIVARWQTGRER